MATAKLSFEIDVEKVCKQIDSFIQGMIEISKTKGLIVGLSGGIDSAVCAALAVRAIGKEKVLGFIEVKKIAITDMVAAFISNADVAIAKNQLALGNVMARLRMVINYAYANHLKYLVLGTSNKSEIMVGYITKYGDGGVDFEPCGDLYKTQIRILAKHLNIPEEIITKAPSAGLWDGQTDEGELGITYDILDLILLAKDKGYSKEQIIEELQIEEALFDKVDKMIKNSEHKRKMPPILELNL
ncbi:MAG: NAD(+) synthase [Candidatus Heimdallarchaeota archaeon]